MLADRTGKNNAPDFALENLKSLILAMMPGEGFKRPWPPLIEVDAAAKAKVAKLFDAR